MKYHTPGNYEEPPHITGECIRCHLRYDLTKGIGCPRCGCPSVVAVRPPDVQQQAKDILSDLEKKRSAIRARVRNILSSSEVIDALAHDKNVDADPWLRKPLRGTCKDCATVYVFERKDYSCPTCKSRRLSYAETKDKEFLLALGDNGELMIIDREDVWAARAAALRLEEDNWLEKLGSLEDKREEKQ